MLMTALGSSDRFDQLCTLVGEGIISGIWLYASENPDVILASLDALPPLVRALGIGNARYLKVCYNSSRVRHYSSILILDHRHSCSS
jgi:hypothetical protein